MRRTCLLFLILGLLPVFSACSEGGPQELLFEPDPFEAPDALPGYTSSGVLTLTNTTGTTYTLTAFSISGGGNDGEDAQRFEAVLADDIELPHDLPPDSSVELVVVFSPETLASYESVLTASLSLSDYVVGGGGCSAGCGRDAPEDLIEFATAILRGTGSADATFEDCEDRQDNDGDGLIDCEDPDCATHPDCASFEICDDGVDNDNDGDIDCADPDCALDPECIGDDEICDDGVDNDGDGDVDCDDNDCILDPACGGLRGCEPVGEVTCRQELFGNTEEAENNWQSYCGDGPAGWTGPEDIWAFIPKESGAVSVAAAAEWDLDLTILEAVVEDDELVCEPTECVATSWSPPDVEVESTEFLAVEGRVYLIVLDGWQDAEGEYEMIVSCEEVGDFEIDCDDGIDNDGDGDIDCEDEDCEGHPDCEPDAYCQIIDLLECGESVSATNDMVGSTNAIDSWCGDPNPGFTGPEVGFVFFRQGPPTEITVSLTGLEADLDLMVLEAELNPPPPPDCNPNLCIETDFSPDTEPEVVTFTTQPGQPYIFAIDGWGGAVSPFTLTVSCGDSTDPEICDDGIDNDDDGLVDCDDFQDCLSFPTCDYGDGDCCIDNGTTGCENEIGEDCVCALDAFCCLQSWDAICADIFEDQCGGTCDTPPLDPEVCDNNVDDDGDGLVDCDDADCFGDPNCVIPTNETDCSNGIDDDADGATDCDDTDCAADPNCNTPPPEICDNGIDDDGDGLFDCADPDCAADPNCNTPGTETNCANNLDDDADGLIDCDDPDCTTDPNCNIIPFELDCFDGVDNDSDGDTDCDDSDCAALPGCTNPAEADCANGIDDDADGWTDCNDSDCALDPNCANGETDCTDTIDNDGDGDIDCDDSDCVADVACVDPGSCSPMGNLSCGDVITGSNSMAGSATDLDEYCGFNPGGWGGPEVSWVFTPDFDGVVEIALSGLTQDLDIQALSETPDGGCDPDDCVANGWNPPPQPEAMDWFAFAGTPYYVVIDGWQGAISNFTMTVTCTPATEVDCSDNIDNDQDGALDCDDTDCLGSPACPETDCTDSIDNDADGHIDCADPDCFGTATCIPELNCVDGIDNDQDGSADCDDSDCATAPACLPETDCEDGLDNDADGAIDCDDSDCNTSAVCGSCYPSTAVLECGDVYFGDNSGGINELEDYCGASGGTFSAPEDYFVVAPAVSADVTVSLFGLAADLDVFALLDAPTGGCAPDNCAAYDPATGTTPEDIEFPAAAGSETFVVVDGWNGSTSAYGLAVICNATVGPEVCDDGLDNDGDGDEDCFDSDCIGAPNCNTETDCANGFDDDADGLADCNDPDCFGEPGCPEILFSSVDDDPLDFVFVAGGPHSSSTSWEQGVPDTTSQSGNGPTAPFNGANAWCTGCTDPVVDGGRFSGSLLAQPLIFDLSTYTSGSLTLSWYNWQESPPIGSGIIDWFQVTASDDVWVTSNVEWGPNAVSTGDWDYQEIDLTSYLGGTLSFAMGYDSVNWFPSDADGIYIDDVVLVWDP